MTSKLTPSLYCTQSYKRRAKIAPDIPSPMRAYGILPASLSFALCTARSFFRCRSFTLDGSAFRLPICDCSSPNPGMVMPTA